ncbi:MAG: hypothetical protein IT379_20495, partial [Deltaproteobacteria bacterium]|nr:hypothetical protein [Deltaproteobacteria bacterium]
DASTLDDAGARLESGACTAWCAEPVEIARIELPRAEVPWGPYMVEHIAIADEQLGSLVRVRDAANEVDHVYTLVLTDLATGATNLHRGNGGFEGFVGVLGSELRGDADGWHTPVAYAPAVGAWMGGEALVGVLEWRRDGTEASWSPGPTMPTPVSSCECDRPVAFAPLGDRGWLAAIVQGPSVFYAWLGVDATPAGGTLLDLGPSPAGATPLSARFLVDGSLAVVGGGSASGLERRAGFLAIGAPGESDWIARAIPGEPYDGAPILVARDTGPTVVRFATDAADVGTSGMRVVAYDGSLEVRSDTRIATTLGLTPSALTAFESSDGTSVAWTMEGVTGTVESTLHVVGLHDEIACSTVDSRPVARFPGLSTSSLAATWLDGDVIVATVLDGAGDTDELVLPRVPGCAITRTD